MMMVRIAQEPWLPSTESEVGSTGSLGGFRFSGAWCGRAAPYKYSDTDHSERFELLLMSGEYFTSVQFQCMDHQPNVGCGPATPFS
ncbi:MAG: hypothetical protein ABW124_03550 [Candidatus Thiodiazotropha sp. 6PLUC9]